MNTPAGSSPAGGSPAGGTPPSNTPPIMGWAPSGSTISSGVGGAAAIVVVAILDRFLKVPLDATTVAALTTLCSAGVGYFFEGGRH